MQILKANAGLLSNFEVKDLLAKRGADKGALGGISVGECKVYDYLVQTPAGTQTRESLEEFVSGVKSYSLTDAERLQTVNLRPSTAVEVHLIVEDCDERLSEAQVDRFIGTVTEVLPEPPLKPEAEGAGEEETEDANPDRAEETEDVPEDAES